MSQSAPRVPDIDVDNPSAAASAASGNLNNVATSSAAISTTPKDPDTCCICLSAITERAIAYPCNHYNFDFLCLASWVQEHPKCPLCNTALTALDYDFRAVDDFKRYSVPRDPEHSKDARRTNTLRGISNLSRQGDRGTHQGSASRGRGRYTERTSRQTGPSREHQNPASSIDTALSLRRHIYHHQLYSLHIGQNRHSRFSSYTPTSITRSPHLQSRARLFLHRELRVFDFTPQTLEFLTQYTLSILRTVELKHASGKAQELLGEFLGMENARLMCHELDAWLRSPFLSLGDWDRWAQYPSPPVVVVAEGEAGFAPKGDC